MGFYEGYKVFRKEMGKIKIHPFFSKKEAYLRILEEGEPGVIISENDSLEEQVKGIIHEIIHLSRKYRRRGSAFMRRLANPEEYDQIEKEIETQTQGVYNTQPNLVKKLKEEIKKADRINPFSL